MQYTVRIEETESGDGIMEAVMDHPEGEELDVALLLASLVVKLDPQAIDIAFMSLHKEELV